jgi:hypothetical protein
MNIKPEEISKTFEQTKEKFKKGGNEWGEELVENHHQQYKI